MVALFKLTNLYWQEKIDDVKGNIGSFDLENKTITGPQNKLLDASTMWNQYLKAAQSRGVKPDYTTWKQNYNLLVKQDNQQFLNTLDSAMAFCWKQFSKYSTNCIKFSFGVSTSV